MLRALRIIPILLAFILFTSTIHAQEVSFKDSIGLYNYQRIKKNAKGKQALTYWGIANAVSGMGCFAAKQEEWKGFWGMNAGWGVLNAVSGEIGLGKALRQSRMKPGPRQAYDLYRRDTRHYITAACFDVACIAGGAALTKYSGNMSNPALMQGFGRSVMLQGIALLVFDNIMYGAQMSNSVKWYRIMDEIRFTGGGVGFNYTF